MFVFITFFDHPVDSRPTGGIGASYTPSTLPHVTAATRHCNPIAPHFYRRVYTGWPKISHYRIIKKS